MEGMKVFHRIMAGVFGMLLLAATLVAVSYIQVGTGSGVVGWLVPGALAASALYMAIRFLRFALRKN
jgi:hypothetical protein